MSNDEFYKWTKELEERSKKCMIYLNEENKIRRMLIEYSKNDLIDYITNLQEENERLRTALNGSEEKRKRTIEYIKSNYIDNPIEFKEDLLNILNGGDEE